MLSLGLEYLVSSVAILLIAALVAAIKSGRRAARDAAAPVAAQAPKAPPPMLEIPEAPPAPLPSLSTLPHGSVKTGDLRVGDVIHVETDGDWKIRMEYLNAVSGHFMVTIAYTDRKKKRIERFEALLDGSWHDGIFRHRAIIVGSQLRFLRGLDAAGFEGIFTMSTPRVVRVLVEPCESEVAAS